MPKFIKRVTVCCRCGTEFCNIMPGYKRKTCSKECMHSHTTKTKEKLSVIRKKFLSENPDAHVWKRSTKFISVPCENVKLYLRNNNISFIEEYTPLSNKAYAIDIAFPNIKVGIEINGNQHYDNYGKLKPYYQRRHDEIVDAGWNIIEVHYKYCFCEENIKRILDFDVPFGSNEQIETIKRSIPKRNGVVSEIVNKIDKWEDVKDTIFDVGINFHRYGWVGELAKYLGIKPQKVNAWMLKYHKQFYDTLCFKRKIYESGENYDDYDYDRDSCFG